MKKKNKLPKTIKVTLRWGKLKHSLGFYKGFSLGLLTSMLIYFTFKFYESLSII